MTTAEQPSAGHEELVASALAQPWYHTIDLGGGRHTPGSVDLRKTAPKLLPASLGGKRALDVGTFDGFWCYSMEALGAELTAIDLESFDDTDLPPRNRPHLQAETIDGVPSDRWRLAHQILGSNARWVASRIYDLTPEKIGGLVDYVVVSDLLIHLRDPVGGLEAVRSVLKPDGRLLLSEQVNPWLTITNPRKPTGSFQPMRHNYNWWEGNLACVRGWLWQAGFVPQKRSFFRLRAVKGQNRPHVAFESTVDPDFTPSWRGRPEGYLPTR